MAAPTVNGTATTAVGASNTTSAGTVTKPTGTTTGETLILVADYYSPTAVPGSCTPTAGFTARTAFTSVNAAGHYVSTYLFDRVVDGSEGASFTATFGNSTTGGNGSIMCLRLSAGAAFDVGNSSHEDGANPACPGVTTTRADALLLLSANRSSSFTTTITGYTLGVRWDSNFSAYYTATQTTAGASITPTFTTATGFHVALCLAAYSVSAGGGTTYSLTATGTATSTGSLDVVIVPPGPATYSLTATGTATSTGSVAVAIAPRSYDLTATGTATSTGSLAVAIAPRSYDLTATGTATSTGSLAVAIVSGSATYSLTATGTGTTTGSLAVNVLIVVSATGTGTTAGSLAVNVLIVISATGTGTTTGSLDLIRGPLPLTATGVAATTGTLAVNRLAAVSATGTGTSAGTLAVAITLAAPVSRALSATGYATTMGYIGVFNPSTASGTALRRGAALGGYQPRNTPAERRAFFDEQRKLAKLAARIEALEP